MTLKLSQLSTKLKLKLKLSLAINIIISIKKLFCYIDLVLLVGSINDSDVTSWQKIHFAHAVAGTQDEPILPTALVDG